jgi:hypothetical protein
MPRVDIKLLSARGLPPCNPFVLACIAGEEKKSSVAMGATGKPAWQDLLRFDVPSATEAAIKIVDRDVISGDEVIAEGTVALGSLRPNEIEDTWVPLKPVAGGEAVELRVRMCLHAQDVLAKGGAGAPPSGPRIEGASPAASAAASSAAASVKEQTGIDGLSPEQVAKVRIAFELFDTDGNNTMDKSEATAALLHYFPAASATDIVRRIQALDVNRDGVLSFEEFATVARAFEL